MQQTTALSLYISTEQFAETIHGKPSTIRTRLCKTGSYYGIKPIKLPSGRLLWPADAVQSLINGEEA
uniref:DNA-binding protein n=1 Tax=Rheinheimera sp. BAL341 TaxID=1708203 RepID=A0A486XIN2_9GAMM